MTKSLTTMSAGIITMMALMGNAYAATTACPAVSDIKQTIMYTAAAPNGQQWMGEDPRVDDTVLKNVTI